MSIDKMNEEKKLVYDHLLRLLNEKLNTALLAVNDARKSRDTETKSSAGDKHETGRAMSQIELDNCEIQLRKINQQIVQLTQIDIEIKHEKVNLGSFVKTNQGDYFISIGIGKVEIEGEVYFSISQASPIGKALHNREVGDVINFLNNEINILDIV